MERQPASWFRLVSGVTDDMSLDLSSQASRAKASYMMAVKLADGTTNPLSLTSAS